MADIYLSSIKGNYARPLIGQGIVLQHNKVLLEYSGMTFLRGQYSLKYSDVPATYPFKTDPTAYRFSFDSFVGSPGAPVLPESVRVYAVGPVSGQAVMIASFAAGSVNLAYTTDSFNTATLSDTGLDVACNSADFGSSGVVLATTGKQADRMYIVKTSNGTSWATAQMSTLNEESLGIATDKAGVWCVIGANGTILRSTNNGTSFTSVRTAASSSGVGICTDRAGNWLAVTADRTVLRSTDNGATWSTATSIPGTGSLGFAAKLLETDRNGTWMLALTGIQESGLIGYRTADFGTSWSEVYSFLTSGSISFLWFDGDGVWSATAPASSPPTALVSTDNAISFSATLDRDSFSQHTIVLDWKNNKMALGGAAGDYFRKSKASLYFPSSQHYYRIK